MMLVAGIIGALGLVCLLTRKTLLGLLIGLQLLGLGSTLVFVLAGIQAGARIQGHLFGLFIVLGGVAQLVAGYALVVRFFYLKKRTGTNDLRSLRQ